MVLEAVSQHGIDLLVICLLGNCISLTTVYILRHWSAQVFEERRSSSQPPYYPRVLSEQLSAGEEAVGQRLCIAKMSASHSVGFQNSPVKASATNDCRRRSALKTASAFVAFRRLQTSIELLTPRAMSIKAVPEDLPIFVRWRAYQQSSLHQQMLSKMRVDKCLRTRHLSSATDFD